MSGRESAWHCTYRPDVWMSLSAVPDAMRSRAGLALAARLKPGVSIEQDVAVLREAGKVVRVFDEGNQNAHALYMSEGVRQVAEAFRRVVLERRGGCASSGRVGGSARAGQNVTRSGAFKT